MTGQLIGRGGVINDANAVKPIMINFFIKVNNDLRRVLDENIVQILQLTKNL
jgi:hypothetical protein